MIGRSVPRKEDERLVTGRGCYVDDVRVPGMLHVAFLRSMHAHANVAIRSCDEARALAGVMAVATAADFPELSQPLTELHEPGTLHNPYCDKNVAPHQILFPGRVRHVGEHFAAVVAESADIAADAAGLITVDYEPLPVVAGWEAAMRPESSRVHEAHDNVLAHLKYELGSFDKAQADADFLIEQRSWRLKLTFLRDCPFHY